MSLAVRRPSFRKLSQFRFLVLMLLAGLSISAGSAIGQAENQSEADAMFRSLDSNKDGKLTLNEAGPNSRQMLQRIFEMANKSTSGSVSRAEFQQVFDRHRAASGGNPNRPPMPTGNRPPETGPEPGNGNAGLSGLLRLLDANQDGRLSRQELARLNEMFDRLDRNQDGNLDRQELEQAGSPMSADVGSTRPEQTPGSRSGSPVRPAPGQTGASSGDTGSSNPSGATPQLAGVWRGWVVHGRGENPNEGEMQIELTIEGNRIVGREVGTQRAPMSGLGTGSYTITGNGSGQLDADGTGGPSEGRHYMGIYEMQGDTLRWCVSNRGRQRPSAMATDRGNYLMILRKQPSRG